jgi:hypothetical protein
LGAADGGLRSRAGGSLGTGHCEEPNTSVGKYNHAQVWALWRKEEWEELSREEKEWRI